MTEKKICDGCNVREPWEHKCHGGDCECSCNKMSEKCPYEKCEHISRADYSMSGCKLYLAPWHAEHCKSRIDFKAGLDSRQAEIDERDRRIRIIEKELDDAICQLDDIKGK